MKSLHRRSLAAVITAVACLALMAPPAPAAVVNGTIAAGTLALTKTGPPPVNEVFDLAPVPGSPCPASAVTVDTGASGTSANVTALDTRGIRAIGGTNYLVRLRRIASTAGTITGSSSPWTISNVRLTIAADIYTAPASGCDLPTTPLCRLAVQLVLNGTPPTEGYFGAGGGTPAAPAAGDYAILSGGSISPHVVANPTCTAGPSYLVGTTASVTGLRVNF